ncbi:uncharacterized protein LOC106156217 [Lingula anatina]|uniref:Uncharacterized protein LOC106156217 n=1 Tax=Lingula anatina TaxID=7574 RepID=A0A1S3HL95_LINAN|nr:uncharacterized protein LOC106156217 [Lingula anatina]|eukprot:XP_013386797.1 uncharacterized protein LOC106156217 [Lingula anatina]
METQIISRQDSVAMEKDKTWEKAAKVSFRKRLTKYLYSYPLLMAISILSIADAACVVGEVLIDLTLTNGKTEAAESYVTSIRQALYDRFPHLKSIATESVSDLIRKISNIHCPRPTTSESTVSHAPTQTEEPGVLYLNVLTGSLTKQAVPGQPSNCSLPGDTDQCPHALEHVLKEIGHVLHMLSLFILSSIVFVHCLRIIATKRRFFQYKFQVFDAAVVTISLVLDLAFLKGIWSDDTGEAAVLVLVLVPWRVIRIVNSFVMTVKEKDHIAMKMVKSGRKKALKRVSDLIKQAERHKQEIRALRGLCKKFEAPEDAINACKPQVGNENRFRRRSSGASLTMLASLAAFGSLGLDPSKVHPSDDEESEDGSQPYLPTSLHEKSSSVNSETTENRAVDDDSPSNNNFGDSFFSNDDTDKNALDFYNENETCVELQSTRQEQQKENDKFALVELPEKKPRSFSVSSIGTASSFLKSPIKRLRSLTYTEGNGADSEPRSSHTATLVDNMEIPNEQNEITHC